MTYSKAPLDGLAEVHGTTYQLPGYNLWELLTSTGDRNLKNTALIALHHSSTHLSYLFPREHSSSQHKDYFTCTHAELRTAAKHVAYVLFSKGIRKGDCIAFFAWNCAEWAVLYWASAWLGTVFVALDPVILQRPDDLAYHLDLLKPKVLISGDKDDVKVALESKDLKELLNSVPVKSYLHEGTSSTSEAAGGIQSFEDLITGSPRDLCSRIRDQVRDRNVPTAVDVSMVLFTSGTTSRPKGCLWTPAGITTVAQHFTKYASLESTSVYVLHTACFRGICFAWSTPTWAAGGAVVMPSEKFQSKTTLAAIELLRATHLTCVPHMIHVIAADPKLESYDKQSVKAVFVGGDIIFSDVLERTKWVLCADWAVPLYGQTEGIGYCEWGKNDKIPTLDSGVVSIGRVAPGASIRICVPGTRRVAAVGEYGVMHVSNSSTISTYLPPRDQENFYQDNGRRWFDTGDQAMIDATGAVFVTGRYKDTIKVDAVNYSPAVIEGSLQKIEGVTAHVVGIPHPVHGSVPAAIIASKVHPPTEKLKQLLRDIVKRDVGEDAHFHDVYMLEELGLDDYPLNNSGKVMKRELAGMLADVKSKPNGKPT